MRRWPPSGRPSPEAELVADVMAEATPSGRRSGVWLAVDPGEVRTGVAASDTGQVLASPVATLTRAECVTGVAHVVADRNAAGVIVGHPLSLTGAEGTAARSARSYAEKLAKDLQIPVYLVDERLTTVSAGAALRAGGHDARSARRVVDQAAATALLQGVLDACAARGLDCAGVLDGGLGERVDPGQDSDEGSDEGSDRGDRT
jgi:putative Holliday junction resolvase